MPSEQPREGTRVEGCQHDSTRVDGWLDDCCLRCGASGYFKDGHYVDPTGKQTKGHPSGKTLIWPERPRGEEAGVNPFNDTTGEGSPLTTGLFRRTVDQVGNLDARREAAPPRGEGDDLDELATLLEAWADEPPSERKDWFLVAGHLREAASALRASTHPEQSGRVEYRMARDGNNRPVVAPATDDLEALRDLTSDDSQIEQRVVGEWRPLDQSASPTPTEARVDPDPLCSVCGHPRSDHDDGKGEAS